jgi:hypothetical protein
MHGTIMLLTHVWLIDPLGHVYVELKLEEPTEQTQVEDPANFVWIKASSGAFNQCSLSFILNLPLCYS